MDQTKQNMIVIVNWNTKNLLAECLAAVCSGIDQCEVIVVDNGSTDGSVDLVKEKFPAARLISNTDNLGFGAANNQAIKIAKGKYILFLNTDAVVGKHTINKMIEFMDSNPKAALCTGTLIRSNGSIQDTFGPYPSLLTELLGRSLLRILFPNRYTPRSSVDIGTRKEQTVDSIRGACMLARYSAIEDIGGFDERFFLFLEETDLCLRLNKNGYEIWWLPSLKIYHKGGGSASEGAKSASARIEYWRSRYLFFYKHYPGWKYRAVKYELLFRLVINWILNLFGSIAKPCRRKVKYYSTIILWHILGCPFDWGLDSDNTIKIDNDIVRKQFVSWWKENKKRVLETGDIIKNSAHRNLVDYRGEVYVKRYKTRYSLLREWRLCSRLRQVNIPTVMPIVLGRGYLVTQKLKEVESLHNYVLQNIERLSFQEKLDLTQSLAGFITKIHGKGLYHGDLHAGNILIDYLRVTQEQFYITDLHRAALKMRLSRREILRNLVQFNIFFSLQASRTLRLGFLKYYTDDYKRYARIIETKTKRACRKLWRKRDKLYLKKEKYGIKSVSGDMKYIVNPKYAKLDLTRIFSYLKPLNAGVSLKDSKSSFLCLLSLPEEGRVVLKVYRQKKFVNYIKDIFRNSRAFRAFCCSWALSERQISTPQPILAVERRHLGILKESYFVYKDVSAVDNLSIWINKNWKNKSFIFKKYFINSFAHFVKTIHNRGISPCDFKGTNVLVKENGKEVKFYLIDLDYIKKKNTVSLNRRIRNISQLNKSCEVSAVMRWRFLKEYFHKKDLDERKEIAREVYRYT